MAENFSELADKLVDGDLSDAHLDVQSLAATYKARRDDEDPRAGVFARALVNRARSTGLDVDGGSSLADMTVADLKAELERRNEGRDEADLIAPEGTKKADLIAALEADDAKA
jgi:hypothetical protein